MKTLTSAIDMSMAKVGVYRLLPEDRTINIFYRQKAGPTLQLELNLWLKNKEYPAAYGFFLNLPNSLVIISHGDSSGILWYENSIEKLLRKFHGYEYINEIIIICCHSEKVAGNYIPLWEICYPKLKFIATKNTLWISLWKDLVTIAEEI